MRNQHHSELLLDAFPVPSLEQWHQEVERLLKGAPFAKKMYTRTLEGLTLEPMYTAKDTENLPGTGNLLSGGAAAWMVAQELPLPTGDEFNKALRSDLARGLEVAHLVLDEAGRAGLDRGQAPVAMVGRNGVSLATLADLETALAGVDLTTTQVFIRAGVSALPMLSFLSAILDRQGIDPAGLSGCVGFDILGSLASRGKPFPGLEALYDQAAVMVRWTADHAPRLRSLPVFEDPWHDGGADSALSLGLTLASAVQSLRYLEPRGVSPEMAAATIQFNLSLGSDFFMELAKVRALRLLWSDVLSAAGCPTASDPVWIHARTSRRTRSRYDREVNMLRVTTQAMSGVFGGVDSLHVAPFDELDGPPEEFSRRIARNVQLILAHECHFDQVSDPAGGSWYVEKLTADLAAKAWEVFQEIEAGGGLLAGLESGVVQERIAAVAARRRERLATRRDVLVGINQYPNPKEKRPVPRVGNPQPLKDQHAVSGDPEEKKRLLGQLKVSFASGSKGLLPLMVKAAATGASLGELAGSLAGGGDLTVEPIPLRRDAAAFEDLRFRTSALENRARVFLLCLGDVARYMPRLDFTRGFFQCGGFQVVDDGSFDDPRAGALTAAGSQAPVVVLVGLDETYREMAETVLQELLATEPRPRVILAGGPPELLAGLLELGLDQGIHARSNALEVLGQLSEQLGVQS